jgi:hypothetical protein
VSFDLFIPICWFVCNHVFFYLFEDNLMIYIKKTKRRRYQFEIVTLKNNTKMSSMKQIKTTQPAEEDSRDDVARRRLRQKLLDKRKKSIFSNISQQNISQKKTSKSSSSKTGSAVIQEDLSEVDMAEINNGLKKFNVKSMPRSSKDINQLLRHALSQLPEKYIKKTIDMIRTKYASEFGDRVESVWKDMQEETLLKRKP